MSTRRIIYQGWEEPTDDKSLSQVEVKPETAVKSIQPALIEPECPCENVTPVRQSPREEGDSANGTDLPTD
jgi:hypothetical protein